MNYITYVIVSLICTSSLYCSENNKFAIKMIRYFSDQPFSEICKPNETTCSLDDRINALKNKDIVLIFLKRVTAEPVFAATNLYTLGERSKLLAPKSDTDTTTSIYIKTKTLYDNLYTIAAKDENFENAYKNAKITLPNAQDILNSQSSHTSTSHANTSQTNKSILPTTTDLLAYIAEYGDLGLPIFINAHKILYSSKTACLMHCHRLLHDAYDNHHAKLMSTIKKTIGFVNNNTITSAEIDIEYDNEIQSFNKFFEIICKEALGKLPLRSLHANPNDHRISLNFFKRHSLTLTAAAAVTVVSAYYAYNYWHASETADTVSAQ